MVGRCPSKVQLRQELGAWRQSPILTPLLKITHFPELLTIDLGYHHQGHDVVHGILQQLHLENRKETESSGHSGTSSCDTFPATRALSSLRGGRTAEVDPVVTGTQQPGQGHQAISAALKVPQAEAA